MRLHHVAVVVANLARAERFYAGVLGLEVRARHNDAAGAPRAVWLTLGDAILMLELAGRSGPMRNTASPGWHCVALAIAPSERTSWRARLSAAGVTIERESDYSLYLRDPDGNLLALSHYPQPVA